VIRVCREHENRAAFRRFVVAHDYVLYVLPLELFYCCFIYFMYCFMFVCFIENIFT